MNIGWTQLILLRVLGLALFGNLPKVMRDRVESARVIQRELNASQQDSAVPKVDSTKSDPKDMKDSHPTKEPKAPKNS